jgi:F0F1-type ATP synthase assembly protein I
LAAEKQTGPAPGAPRNTPTSDVRTVASVIELPIILVAAVLVGGALGHLLDRWLHRDSLFTLILGGLGFIAGITEVLRRLSREEKREEESSTNKGDDGQ